jgi:hypothetical protein
MGWDDVSELWPPTCLLFIYQVIYEHGESLWNDTEGLKTKELTTNPAWTDLGINPGLHWDRWLLMLMGWKCLWTATSNRLVVRLPDDIWVWRVIVEWYWQGKTKELGENPFSVSLHPPQIPHGLTWAQTQASAVRGQRLTACTMAWLIGSLLVS